MSRLIATFFYVGLMRPAPGTWGSLAALPCGVVLHGLGGFPLLLAGIVLAFALGVWATKAETAGKADHDPSEIVIDEVVGQWIALAPFSFAFWYMGNGVDFHMPLLFLGLSFALFRFFDILKPGPVGWADRRHDAWGVMLDDVIAGLLAALVVIALMQWHHHIFALLEATGWDILP